MRTARPGRARNADRVALCIHPRAIPRLSLAFIPAVMSFRPGLRPPLWSFSRRINIREVQTWRGHAGIFTSARLRTIFVPIVKRSGPFYDGHENGPALILLFLPHIP